MLYLLLVILIALKVAAIGFVYAFGPYAAIPVVAILYLIATLIAAKQAEPAPR
ncbi:MAG TPA: hypothetical protein PLR41_07640 [Alphaproteobacteria bacterium]|nr:hypothetical protein [Alphaproteobacteria bacterium]